jgi:hypothetical protein
MIFADLVIEIGRTKREILSVVFVVLYSWEKTREQGCKVDRGYAYSSEHTVLLRVNFFSFYVHVIYKYVSVYIVYHEPL